MHVADDDEAFVVDPVARSLGRLVFIGIVFA